MTNWVDRMLFNQLGRHKKKEWCCFDLNINKCGVDLLKMITKFYFPMNNQEEWKSCINKRATDPLFLIQQVYFSLKRVLKRLGAYLKKAAM